MKKKNNISFFPSEKELERVCQELSNPNYDKGNIFLSPGAPLETKLKYKLGKAILIYQQENNLSSQEVAQQLSISEEKLYDICRGEIKEIPLNQLISYTEQLHLPLQININSRYKDREINV